VIFISIFFSYLLARIEYEPNSGLNFFFFSFSADLIPFWLKIMPEWGFLVLWIFLLFFWEFSCWGRVWTEFETNFFFLSFSTYLIPFWLEIMPEICFLIFWFFLLFFSQFSSLAEYERNSGLKFFFLFFGLSHPVLAKSNAGKRFFNFLNFFFLFFLEFSCPDRVWTEFETKISSSHSRPISSRFC